MLVKVRFLVETPEFKAGQEAAVDDAYAVELEAIGACVLLEPNPRAAVKTVALSEPPHSTDVRRTKKK